jgi:hypothetical protein
MKKTIVGAASAVAGIAVIAVAGCATGTTTVGEIPAAPAPVNLAEKGGETVAQVVTS